MSISKKYSCGCKEWRRSPGRCKKCGKTRRHSGWIVDWNDGKRRTKTFRTEAAAKLFDRQRGRDSAVTFFELCDEFLKLHAGANRDGGRGYKSKIEHHFKPFFGDILLSSVLPRHVLEYVALRRTQTNPHGKPLKSATLQGEIRSLKAMWNYARRQRYVESYPFDGVRVPSDPKQIKEVLTREEEERLFEAMKRNRTYPLFVFIAYTGARKMEAVELRWSDVDLKNGIAWVKGKTRGHEEERQALYLDGEIVKMLEEMPRASEFVFVNEKGKPWRAPSVVLAQIAKRLGLRIRGTHDLRHLFITRLVQGGANLRFVAGLARHTDIKMTMRYAHFAPEDLRRALEARRNAGATKEKDPPPNSENDGGS